MRSWVPNTAAAAAFPFQKLKPVTNMTDLEAELCLQKRK